MNKKLLLFTAAFAALVVVLSGCRGLVQPIELESPQEQTKDVMEKKEGETIMKKENKAPAPSRVEGMMTKYTGTVLAGSASPLLDYNKADYDAAIGSDKLVVLYFYANWCPICKVEVANALYPAFNELAGDTVVGFRVNYNDNETEDAEEDLARQFGVAYQHTKVFVKNGARLLKSPESWSASRYADEIAKYR